MNFLNMTPVEAAIVRHSRDDARSAYQFNFVIHDGTTPIFSNDPNILRDCMVMLPDRPWPVWKWRHPEIFHLAGVPLPGTVETNPPQSNVAGNVA